MLHADFCKMKSLHKPCSKGKPIQATIQTMLQDIFCLISRPQVFGDFSAFFWWLASLVPFPLCSSREKKGSLLHKNGLCQRGHFREGSLSYLPLVKGIILIFLSQITVYLILVFKNLRQLVSKAEPLKGAVKSCDKYSDRKHRKHENSCNCEKVLTKGFPVVTCLCRILRLGYRSGKVGVNGLGISKCWPHELLHKWLLFSMLDEETNLVNRGSTNKGSSFPCAAQDPDTRREKANTCLLALRSTPFPLESVFQEAWKFFPHILPAFNAGSTHLMKCGAAGGQDLALLLATAPSLFARLGSDRFHQTLCLHAAAVLQCSPVIDAARDQGAKVVLEWVFLRNSPQSYSTHGRRHWSESGNVPCAQVRSRRSSAAHLLPDNFTVHNSQLALGILKSWGMGEFKTDEAALDVPWMCPVVLMSQQILAINWEVYAAWALECYSLLHHTLRQSCAFWLC